MPIQGLSDNVRLPRLGKIHLGIRDQRGIPQKTKYFVLPKDHSDYAALCKVFGPEPTELRVYIPVEDEEKWCEQYYKHYDRTHGLVCKGDGAIAMRLIDTGTGAIANKDSKQVEMREVPCAGKDCPDYKAKKCGEAMNLRFVLPEVPGLGVWQIDTGSINSILNINSCAKLIRKAFGRIAMIPLKLTLEPIEVNNPETKKKQTVYVLNLRTSVTLAQLADVAREQAKQLMIGPAELEAEYEAQIDRDVEDLFGEAPASQKPPNAPPPTQTSAEPPAGPEQRPTTSGDSKNEPAVVGTLAWMIQSLPIIWRGNYEKTLVSWVNANLTKGNPTIGATVKPTLVWEALNDQQRKVLCDHIKAMAEAV